jgi:S-DNA-T family DNA segregation ATPase FtsK/SpoIIIE
MCAVDTCEECGFTYGALARASLAPVIGEAGRELAKLLDGPAGQLTARREPLEWSVVEYGCHVRDVLLIQRDRLYVALVENEPSFKPMYRDERVVFDHYAEQPSDVVGAQILMAAAMTAHAFAGLADDQWARPLIYGFPAPMRRDVEWMAHHTVHEMVHHRGDIERIERLAGPEHVTGSS